MLNTLLAANTPIFPKEIQDRLEVHERIYADSVKALEEEISDNTTPLLNKNSYALLVELIHNERNRELTRKLQLIGKIPPIVLENWWHSNNKYPRMDALSIKTSLLKQLGYAVAEIIAYRHSVGYVKFISPNEEYSREKGVKLIKKFLRKYEADPSLALLFLARTVKQCVKIEVVLKNKEATLFLDNERLSLLEDILYLIIQNSLKFSDNHLVKITLIEWRDYYQLEIENTFNPDAIRELEGNPPISLIMINSILMSIHPDAYFSSVIINKKAFSGVLTLPKYMLFAD